MADGPFNGHGSWMSAVGTVGAIGSILFHQVYADMDIARQERTELRAEISTNRNAAEEARRQNEAKITALSEKFTEVETQMRSMATIANLERQMDAMMEDLLHQCPACKVPERRYFPPGPGIDGKVPTQ